MLPVVSVSAEMTPVVKVPGFTADVIVCDNGESVNDDPDTFSITVTNDESGEIVANCTVEETPLANGDVQVHPSHGNCPPN